MSRIVYKFPFDDADEVEIPWLADTRLALIAAQPPDAKTPTLWVEYDAADYLPAAPKRSFVLVGTGQRIDTFAADREHVGSVVCAVGALVWHVYGRAVRS